MTVLLKCAKKDAHSRTRSLALCSLAVFLSQELTSDKQHSKVLEAINVLLASLKVSPVVSEIIVYIR